MNVRLWLLLISTLLIGEPSVAHGAQPDESSAKYARLTGKVTDESGAPIAGIRVDISTAGPKVGPAIFCPSCYLDCRKWAKTDEQGEFAIDQLDPHLKFRLVAAGPAHKATQTDLIDPESGPVTLSLTKSPTDIDPNVVLSGVVKNHLGIPIEGALVGPYGAKTADKRWWGRIDVDSTVTDNQGRFAMVLPKEFLGMNIRVFADGYCAVQSDLLQPGPKSTEITMDEGATVTGRLASAGHPVANMSIAIVQVDRSTQNGIFIAAVNSVTDKDGAFEFKNLPPNQKYAIFSVVGEARRTTTDLILTTKTFTVPASGQSRDLGKLSVSKPVSISGKLVRADGQPMSSSTKLVLGRDPAWDLISFPINEDGTFSIDGLPPETYEIRVAGRGLELVADKIPYQLLSPQSFGVLVTSSVKDLVITVKGN